ncbi:MAG: hypothetical protein H8D67_22795 [Deltaproteobacteria bacterium]|nr:hypothetical protein [Deltaproteobacteria bacterium]
MKTSNILIIGLFASALFATPLLAQEKCNKNVTYYNPPPGSYKQISPDEARKMKNYTSSDQKEVSITLERIPDKTKARNKK